MAGFSRRATEPLGGPISPLDGRGEELRLYAKGVNNKMKRESTYTPILYPKEETYAEEWLSSHVDLAAGKEIKLSGDESLYFYYSESCREAGVRPLPIRGVAKKLELLLAIKHQEVLSKVKTGKGVYLHDLSLCKTGNV